MSKLPVLGEIGAPVAADGRPWGLRRLDLEALGAVRQRVGGRRVVLVTGFAGATGGADGGDAPPGTSATLGESATSEPGTSAQTSAMLDGGGASAEAEIGAAAEPSATGAPGTSAAPRTSVASETSAMPGTGVAPRTGAMAETGAMSGMSATEEKSMASEAGASVRTAGFDASPMTGAMALAVGLAAAAAAGGTRTVLVECDFGRPRLAAALGLEPVPGLHEYLRWEATPAEVLQTLVPAGSAAGEEAAALACVCAGHPSDSPRTLLGLGSFRHVTAKLREAYELTILVGPPPEEAGSALELVAAEADCSIVALAQRPDRRTAKTIRETLSSLGLPPLGAVVVTPATE